MQRGSRVLNRWPAFAALAGPCFVVACSSAAAPTRALRPTSSSTTATSSLGAPPTATVVSEAIAGDVEPRAAKTHCGTERWPVKTLSDADAGRVDLSPVPATVDGLRALAAPLSLPKGTRIAPTELSTYWVVANVLEFKEEADRDFHVVIADPAHPSDTMIVEFPDASTCDGAIASAEASQMRVAREALIAAYGMPSTEHFTPLSGTASFVGVAFFDFQHGQTGVAPNAIELHPVVAFSTATSTAPALPAAPAGPASGPPAAAAASFTSVVGGAPGGRASATIQTAPGADCAISYTTPAGTHSTAAGLIPETADSSGTASWTWNIGSRTRPGIGSVTVRCGGATATAPITIG